MSHPHFSDLSFSCQLNVFSLKTFEAWSSVKCTVSLKQENLHWYLVPISYQLCYIRSFGFHFVVEEILWRWVFARLLWYCHSLGALEMLQRATVSVCLSILNNAALTTILMKFDILGFFEYVLRNFNFNINLQRIMGTYMKTKTYIGDSGARLDIILKFFYCEWTKRGGQ
jgi:hypothetical protein